MRYVAVLGICCDMITTSWRVRAKTTGLFNIKLLHLMTGHKCIISSFVILARVRQEVVSTFYGFHMAVVSRGNGCYPTTGSCVLCLASSGRQLSTSSTDQPDPPERFIISLRSWNPLNLARPRPEHPNLCKSHASFPVIYLFSVPAYLGTSALCAWTRASADN